MPTRRQATRSAAIVMAAIFLSRVLGLVRDVYIAGALGQGGNTDVYYAAFKLPDVLFYLIAGGALSSSFVPVFVEHLTAGRREEAWRLFSTIATVMALVVGAAVILGEVFARRLVPLLAAPGFTPAKLDQVAHLTRIVLPAQLFFLLGGLLMAVQWAHQRFLIPGLGPSIYNVGIIIGGVAGGAVAGRERVAGLAWGVLAGAFVGNFCLQALAARGCGLRFRAALDIHNPEVRRVWRLMLPVIFSLSLPQVDVWINGWFASFLFEGAISA